MAKKFIPAGIEVQRHLDAFVHVGCISRGCSRMQVLTHTERKERNTEFTQKTGRHIGCSLMCSVMAS